jgi:ectoine hydroxylase-related dioxygenase (phytanoyl-CoA dioxygenase family)
MNINVEKFNNEGFLGPFKIYDQHQIASLLQERYIPRQYYTWIKSPHEKSEPIVKIAADKNIVDKLKHILKDNILLWGSLFVEQKPGHRNSWHLDVEHCNWNGATVWIGLKNLNNKTSLSLITYSHLLNSSPIELKQKNNLNCDNDQDVLKEAKKLDPRCELKTFYLNPGEFVLWSGKIWHSTLNESSNMRQSIILQYCTPDNLVKIPSNFEYPNTQWSETKPPCILISGKDNYKYNKVLTRDDIKPFSKYLQKFKISVLYNSRYKIAAIYRKLKNYKK